MPTFSQSIAQHQDLSEAKQVKAGQAIAGGMRDEHATFLKRVMELLDSKEIDSSKPESLLNASVYDALPQEWKDKTNLALINLADQLRLIEEFYRSTKTPNSSPHLETMIEQLWNMKERIESNGYDVFKF
ncbi:MAG: hypothetical protein G01um101425_535 [Candidatus Peregrinibacteria bacterium Gr01-1014_25]|nr:MAG: hypothetical protein G01um101425_535 [Candidatus Peregrinibacteria bacterium Gr01-1014_25]